MGGDGWMDIDVPDIDPWISADIYAVCRIGTGPSRPST